MPERGIRPTADGWRARVRVNGQLHQRHFPPHTPMLVMRQWMLDRQLAHGDPGAAPGTFAADAARYLETVKAMPTYDQRAHHIGEWVAVFGARARATITSTEIREQLARWRTEPREVKQRTAPGRPQRTKRLILSAAAVNKRRTALMHLYRTLDGKAAVNPVRDAPKFPTPTEQPRAIPYAAIRAIFAAMPPSKSKARLMVLAYTGLPPALIRTIHPADVRGATVSIQGRKKGRGTQGRVLPLTPEGVKAFAMMDREEAWGPFTGAPLRRAFQRACQRALGRDDLVPYDLRHSFGTEVYRSSGDIRATQVLMGHSTPALTHRYTLAAVDARLTAALAQFGRAKVSGSSVRSRKNPKKVYKA